jgi:ribonuclease Z
MRCSKWLECSTQNRHILSTRHNYIAKGGFRKAILKDAGSVNITERSLQIGSVPNRSSNAMDTKWNNSNTIPFTGFELTFLGTSAGSPSVSRNPTGVCLRLENQNWMFDCAEGSLRQLMKSNIRVPMTNKIFITHLHGDHLYGLPGMLCTLDNHNANYVNPRTRLRARRPIHVYGPLGLFNYLNMAFTTSSTRMTNLEITVHELVSSEILSGASSFERHMNLAPVHQVFVFVHRT